MASSSIRPPRSVGAATRFTSATLLVVAARRSPCPAAAGPVSSVMHASTVSTPPPSSSAARHGLPSRFAPPTGLGTSKTAPRGPAPSPRGGPAPPVSESPEQRVARLRAAHLAAKQAEVSIFDRAVNRARVAFDSIHRITTMGLIIFTVVAGAMTVYTIVDMITINRKRKAEFIEAQKKIEADSLEAARLAYMRNEATPEQIQLVDEANARGQADYGGLFSSVPGIIGAPEAIRPSGAGAAPAPAPATTASDPARAGEEAPPKAPSTTTWGQGIKNFFYSGLKAEDDVVGGGSNSSRRGAGSVSAAATAVADKVLVAYDHEKENQQMGGPLDQIGSEQQQRPPSVAAPAQDSSNSDPAPPRKGWW